jgi:hypothetical protein
MRNRYAGVCYRCRERVEIGEGHFERFRGGWRTQHATCAIERRGTPDQQREADRKARLILQAQGTGKPAQQARQRLRQETTDDFEVLD